MRTARSNIVAEGAELLMVQWRCMGFGKRAEVSRMVLMSD